MPQPLYIKAIPAAVMLAACAFQPAHAEGAKPAKSAPGKPTVAEAERFLNDTESKLEKLNLDSSRAQWVAQNFITDDTEALATYFGERQLSASGEAALGARRYNGLKLKEDYARQL